MPTYLLHGFRWPRPLIRIHIILQDLDDAAAEWLMAPATGRTLLENLGRLYPAAMAALPGLRFIEQYDPLDESGDAKSQPHAYVADVVHEVRLAADVDETRARGIPDDAWAAMVELRDHLAPGEKLSWFVVVCGDVERWAPPAVQDAESDNGVGVPVNGRENGSGDARAEGPLSAGSVAGGSTSSGGGGRRPSTEPPNSARPSTARSLRRFFSRGSLRKSKSSKSISRHGSDASAAPPTPALPKSPPAAPMSPASALESPANTV